MKYLKIEDNKGYYWDGESYQEIDKINKDGLLVLLNLAESDEFEMDEYKEELVANKAHQIIYENIYSKLSEFLIDKDQFTKEVDSLYAEAINKYEADTDAEEFEEAETTDSEDLEDEFDPDDIPF